MLVEGSTVSGGGYYVYDNDILLSNDWHYINE